MLKEATTKREKEYIKTEIKEIQKEVKTVAVEKPKVENTKVEKPKPVALPQVKKAVGGNIRLAMW